MSSSQSILQKRLLTVTLGPFIFSPGWITTIITPSFLVLLFNLGLWQTRRAEFKQNLIDRYETRSQSGDTSIENLLALDKDSMDFPVTLSGKYLHEYTFFLDNRTHRGIPGFQVLTPLDIGTHLVLINRGWVSQGKTREDIPDYPKQTDLRTVAGITHVPNPNYFVLKEDNYQSISWPFIIQKIDLTQSATLFDKPLAPFTVRLNPDKHSGFIREWHSNPMTPEKHYGYAFQWFSLTLALAVIYVTVNTRKQKNMHVDRTSQIESKIASRKEEPLQEKQQGQ